MDFNKDLLLIDIEATGLDAQKHEIIQLAGILLDKKTLKEKEAFSSFIKPARWKNRDPESMAVNKITWEQLKDAPDLKSTLEKFNKTFGREVILSYYVGIMDVTFLQAAYKRAKMEWPFDYHTFNVWGAFYTFLALKNRLKNKKDFGGFNLGDLVKRFKIKVDKAQLHDALVDCRVEAEVLRKVVGR